MKLKYLKDEQPEPYTAFLAHNTKTGEFFPNYLVKSEFNYFYAAGKRFDKWTELA